MIFMVQLSKCRLCSQQTIHGKLCVNCSSFWRINYYGEPELKRGAV